MPPQTKPSVLVFWGSRFRGASHWLLVINPIENCQLVPNFVYSFLEAAITNHHKPGSLKNRAALSHSSGGQKAEISITGPEPGCRQHRAPSRDSRGEPPLCLFQSLLAASISQLCLSHSSLFPSSQHLLFHVSNLPLLLSLIRTLVIVLRVLTVKPR